MAQMAAVPLCDLAVKRIGAQIGRLRHTPLQDIGVVTTAAYVLLSLSTHSIAASLPPGCYDPAALDGNFDASENSDDTILELASGGATQIHSPPLHIDLDTGWLIPTTPVHGEPVAVGFSILNLGPIPATRIAARVYMDSFFMGSFVFPDPEADQDDEDYISVLLPGANTDAITLQTPPLSGAHTIRWLLEADFPTDDGTTTITSATYCGLPTTTLADLPDLTVRIDEPTRAGVGEPVLFRAEILNDSERPIEDPFLVVAISGDDKVISTMVQGLEAQGAFTIERLISATDAFARPLTVVADANKQIDENNEVNNAQTVDVDFVLDPFVISDLRIAPSSLTRGSPALFVVLRNTGTGEAAEESEPVTLSVTEFANVNWVTSQTRTVDASALPVSGGSTVILLPLAQWQFEEKRLYAATTQRHIIIVHNVNNPNDIHYVESSLRDVYAPWLGSPKEQPSLFELGNLDEMTMIMEDMGISQTRLALESGDGYKCDDMSSASCLDEGPSWIEIILNPAEWFDDGDEDAKARATIEALRDGEFEDLSFDELRALLKALYEGGTNTEDEEAALRLFSNLSSQKFMVALEAGGGFEEADDQINHDEWETWLNIMCDKSGGFFFDQKLKLIKGLMDITTDDPEESAVNCLVDSMTIGQRWRMLQTDGFSLGELDEDVGGAEMDRLEELVKPVSHLEEGSEQFDVDGRTCNTIRDWWPNFPYRLDGHPSRGKLFASMRTQDFEGMFGKGSTGWIQTEKVVMQPGSPRAQSLKRLLNEASGEVPGWANLAVAFGTEFVPGSSTAIAAGTWALESAQERKKASQVADLIGDGGNITRTLIVDENNKGQKWLMVAEFFQTSVNRVPRSYLLCSRSYPLAVW